MNLPPHIDFHSSSSSVSSDASRRFGHNNGSWSQKSIRSHLSLLALGAFLEAVEVPMPFIGIGCWTLALFFCFPLFGQDILGEPEEQIIHYQATVGLTDPVSLLQQRLAKGEATLTFEPGRGYLRSLLHELRVPVSSQGLVFSKTSEQEAHTSPQTPRAIYFADDISVGWAPGAPDIDLASVDPTRGPIFYKLAQNPREAPKFTRSSDCLRCHLGNKTLNVPGPLVRSVYTAADGTPLAKVDGFVSGHNSPLSKRWGGWFVTGTHADDVHLGNLFSTNLNNPELLDLSAGGNVTTLSNRCDLSSYLSPHSDIVALLVLEHQVRMQNLLTLANYETRYALAEQTTPSHTAAKSAPNAPDWTQQRIALAGEKLLEYMLFRDEAELKGQVKGTSGFIAEFQKAGPFDSQGRSLRQFDLNKRLFRFPCSFLIYSPAFDALPQQIKNYLWQRLKQILTGADHSPTYAGIPAHDRQAVLEILLDTRSDFAACFRRN